MRVFRLCRCGRGTIPATGQGTAREENGKVLRGSSL